VDDEMDIINTSTNTNGKYIEKHREILEHKKKGISDSVGPRSYILNQPFFT
jgi:hypothetical protein